MPHVCKSVTKVLSRKSRCLKHIFFGFAVALGPVPPPPPPPNPPSMKIRSYSLFLTLPWN